MKNKFPLLKNNPDMVYLDSAATSQKPQCVLDAIQEYYLTSNANAHRGIYGLSIKSTLALDDARSQIATYFNTTDEHIVFTKNTTESLNLLAYASTISKDENIVITEIEHHSNLVPWQEKTRKEGAELRFAKYNKENHNIQDISELVDKNTKIVSFTGMSNVSGQIFDVKKITQLIREKNPNTIIIVDACQLAVHELMDVQDMDVDFMVCSAHKMYGPLGVGILYAKDLEKLSPFLYGGNMIENVSLEKTTYTKGPSRFEAGTLDIANIVGTARAIKFIQENKHTRIKIEKELTKKAVEDLRSIEGMQVVGHNGENAGSIISFYHKTIPSLDIAQFCANENICIRVGQHCSQPFLNALCIKSTLRLSLGFYNTEEDINKIIKNIKRTVQLINKMKGLTK